MPKIVCTSAMMSYELMWQIYKYVYLNACNGICKSSYCMKVRQYVFYIKLFFLNVLYVYLKVL